jgi:hypothetical protein
VALRRLCIAVAVFAALAGYSSRGASAAQPPCPAGGANRLSSAHFTVNYDGDAKQADYITETQAGDILAAAERAYAALTAMGYPPPLVNGSGKTGFSVIDLSSFGVSSIYCPGDVDFDSNDVGKEDTAYSIGFDVFTQIALQLAPGVPFADYWLIQAAGSWASWKALGYPAASATGLGPFEMSLDCWDANVPSTQACSHVGYENLGGSRWAFYEYLSERFGQTFISDVLVDANAAGSAMTGLQTALAAHGTTVATEYAAFTTKLMAGGWTASALNVSTLPTSGSVIHTGAATGDTPPQTFGVDHLATRFIEIDRGDGDAGHACFAATLTIHVQIPNGVTSQPTFYWNGVGSTPVPLAVNGNSATATVPWDTCLWQNKGLLSLPNTSLAANGTNFVVSTHIDVDTTTAATATPPPAPGSTYGQVIDTGSATAVPDVAVLGPQLFRLAATDTQLRVTVFSSGEGSLTAKLGTFDLGTAQLQAGNNDLRFTLPKAKLAQLRTSSATNVLTLTPTSPDGNTTGITLTRSVAFTPATRKAPVRHKKAPVKHKTTKHKK